MSAMQVERKQLISVTEIAKLAGVRSSAVSNWRVRFADFPVPAESGASGDLFDVNAVEKWLGEHGKDFSREAQSFQSVLAHAIHALRGRGASLEDSVLLAMQVIYLWSRFAEVDNNSTGALRAWHLFYQDSNSANWTRLIDEVSREEPELGRVLDLAMSIRDEHLWIVKAELRAVEGGEVPWGSVATALLQYFYDTAGARGAFQATSPKLAELMLALLRPIKGTVYDPACGVAMVLTLAWNSRDDSRVRLVGQEVNEYNYRLGYLHLAANRAQFELASGDTLRDDRFRSQRADRIIVDAPFSQKLELPDVLWDDRWLFGTMRISSDWVWAQQLLYHLAREGTGVMTVSPSSLSRGGVDVAARTQILESNTLDAVVELPPGLHASSAAPISLLVFSRDRLTREGRVLFIDARQLGLPRRGRPREITQYEIGRISRALESWRQGAFQEEAQFTADVSVTEILRKNSDADLSPHRYVHYQSHAISEIEGEPIEERAARLQEELHDAADAVAEAIDVVTEGASSLRINQDSAWPLIRLGDILSGPLLTGVRHEPDKHGPAIPFVTTASVTLGPGYLNQLPNDVTRGDAKGRVAARDDLLLASRGIEPDRPIGCASIRFDGDATYSESLVRIRVDRSRAHPDYLRIYLTSRHGRATLSAIKTGSVIANLRVQALHEIQLPLPPLDEQRRIVAAMTRIEEASERLGTIRDECSDLYDALREGIAAGLFVSTKNAIHRK
jgi:type I restriction enzyme M protein